MAGASDRYAATPLPGKLGIRAGSALLLVGAPPGFAVPGLPDGVVLLPAADPAAPFDTALWFPPDRAGYEAGLPALRAAMAPAAGLWVAWRKRSAGGTGDLDGNVIREVALPTGLVDNKVCAIDERWSGLRLVVRRDLRGEAGRGTPGPP